MLAITAVLSILIGSLRAGISPMPSSRKAHRAVFEMLERTTPDNQQTLTLIDCGSGWGHLLFKLANRYPNARVIGYEMSFIPWVTSYLLAHFFLLRNVTIYRKNFLSQALPVSLQEGDILFTYLYPKGMEKLAKQLAAEHQNTALSSTNQSGPWPLQLISICFALPGFEATEQKNLTDLYRTKVYRYSLEKDPSIIPDRNR
ncbi:hypothetical protein BTA35_0203260 [Oceanospirillum linum]|uniref:Methyltransferase small domain-containing protein n=1 Tax=Oceanospirillum linum TaxID=966 RepID=A0A1T1HFF6_OCELI|nr:hypothetical protein BTA35_0203260 [Oceanospirillum linum]